MEENPFPDLKITNADFLDELEGRQKCSKCDKSRKFYCYSCYIPLKGTEDKIPKIQLPVKIDIIKHRQEVDGKSTSGHAALVAPEQVTVYTYPTIPEYKDSSKVLLVFPGPDALTLEEYVAKFSKPIEEMCEVNESSITNGECSESNVNSRCSASQHCNSHGQICEKGTHKNLPEHDTSQIMGRQPSSQRRQHFEKTFDRVVFIDSTWHQVASIRSDERLQCLQKVEIKAHTTKFWRHQRNKPDSHLATIEAIYYFVREYHDMFETTPYTSQYDDLLFFFLFMYKKIRYEFEKGKFLKAYQKNVM